MDQAENFILWFVVCTFCVCCLLLLTLKCITYYWTHRLKQMQSYAQLAHLAAIKAKERLSTIQSIIDTYNFRLASKGSKPCEYLCCKRSNPCHIHQPQ